MTEDKKLHAMQINHGQSEIWLEADNKEQSSRRTLATNEVFYITRRLCEQDVFQAFYAECHIALGRVATLAGPNLDEIAQELKLTNDSGSEEEL
jgi:hypothetical protein